EGDEFILQDEFIPQKEIGLSDPSASREPRTFLFPAGLAARARATELTRQVANADSVTVTRLEARAAQGKSVRGPVVSRWFAVSSIAAVMVGAALIGWYFHAELAAYVTRYTGEQDNVRIGTVGVEIIEQEAQVPSQDSQKADSLARDRALQKEHERAEAVAGELTKARRDIEAQLALPSKARDQAAQRNQAAEKATASLRQSLKTEHDRAEALTGELAKARRDLEAQLALSSKAGDEAAQEKKAAESATAELRQSLQKEHDRAEALTGDLAKAQRELETQLALS